MRAVGLLCLCRSRPNRRHSRHGCPPDRAKATPHPFDESVLTSLLSGLRSLQPGSAGVADELGRITDYRMLTAF